MTEEGAITGLRLERASTPERVAAVLRDEILSGRIPPGAFVRESTIAGELGISRNTLREAIQILVARGLIVRNAHRGAQVRRSAPEDVRDLYKIRLILESQAIDQVGPGTDLGPLRAALAELAEGVEEAETDLVAAADLAFHEALALTLGSRRLLELLRETEDEIRLSIAATGARIPPEELLADARSLVDAIERDDHHRAQAILAGHLKRSRDRLLEALAAVDQTASSAI